MNFMINPQTVALGHSTGLNMLPRNLYFSYKLKKVEDSLEIVVKATFFV